MDSIMFFRDADPRRAGGTVRARRQYRFRLFRVRAPEVLWIVVEPWIVQNARDGRGTFGTVIRSPAASSFFPGFSSVNSFGELWNLSPSSSSGVSKPSHFIFAFSWTSTGAGWNGPFSSARVIV
jgi:hypothetical protein